MGHQYIQLKCEDCGKIFNRREDHQNAGLRTHKGKTFCKTCGYRHLERKPSVMKKIEFICEKCNKTFLRTETHNNRLKLKHDNKVFCGLCSHGYSQSKYYANLSEEEMNKFKEKVKKNSYLANVYNKQQKGKTLEERLGKEKANIAKKKMGKAHKGENNHQFGKPSPQGSGNGWSGWYKGTYFRSLKELSYLVNIIEKNNIVFENAEKSKYKIPYLHLDNTIHYYYADYVIDNMIIEIKPARAKSFALNIAKSKGAEEWCKKHNMIYKLIGDDEFDQLSKKEIYELRKRGEIKFIERYEKKFIERYSDFLI